jgi:hypothetical protein
MGDIPRGLAISEEGLELARQLDYKTGVLITVLTQYSMVLLLVPGEESRAMTLAEEGLELAHRMGSPAQEALPRMILAVSARRHGDLAQAGALSAEALRLAWGHGLTIHLPDFLDEMALVAEGRGQGERAARLLGAAAAMFEVTGLQPDYTLYPDVEAMMARGKAALGEEAWAEAFAAGKKLTLEDAVAEALARTAAEVTSRLTPPE